MQGKCGSVHNRKMIFIQSGKKCDKIKSNYSVGSIPRGILARNCEAAEQLRRKYYCRKKSLQILLGVIEKKSVF